MTENKHYAYGGAAVDTWEDAMASKDQPAVISETGQRQDDPNERTGVVITACLDGKTAAQSKIGAGKSSRSQPQKP